MVENAGLDCKSNGKSLKDIKWGSENMCEEEKTSEDQALGHPT